MDKLPDSVVTGVLILVAGIATVVLSIAWGVGKLLP